MSRDTRLPPFDVVGDTVRLIERRSRQKMMATHDGDATLAAPATGVALRYFQLLRSRCGA